MASRGSRDSVGHHSHVWNLLGADEQGAQAPSERSGAPLEEALSDAFQSGRGDSEDASDLGWLGPAIAEQTEEAQ